MLHAQDTTAQVHKAFVTVTNKADFDLSLSLTFNPAALSATNGSVSVSNAASSFNVAPFQVRRIVKAQHQTTFTIPRGDYTVEAITAPQADQKIIRQRRDPSNERENSILNNEVWTFELDKGPQMEDNTQPAGTLPALHTWKRHIWPVRQSNASGTSGLRALPQRPQQLESSEAQELSLPKTNLAAPKNLRVVDPSVAPTP